MGKYLTKLFCVFKTDFIFGPHVSLIRVTNQLARVKNPISIKVLDSGRISWYHTYVSSFGTILIPQLGWGGFISLYQGKGISPLDVNQCQATFRKRCYPSCMSSFSISGEKMWLQSSTIPMPSWLSTTLRKVHFHTSV